MLKYNQRGNYAIGAGPVAVCANREDVVRFLLDMKKTLSQKDSLQLVQRKTNLQTLTSLGYTVDDVKMILFNLGVTDYSSGPEPDDNPNYSGDVWVFGATIDTIDLYIKLKLINCGQKQVLCLSFHHAKWPLNYPFKK